MAYVQSSGILREAAAGASSAVTLAFLPTVGNRLILKVGGWHDITGFDVSAVSDNHGNTWTRDAASALGSGNVRSLIYSCAVAVASGSFTITIAYTDASGNYVAAEVSEHTDLSGAALDITITNASNSTTANASTGASASTTQANELIVTTCALDTPDSTCNFTTATTGYTNRARENDSGTYCGFSSDEKYVTSAGVQSADWTHDHTGQEGWTAALATYKVPAGGTERHQTRRTIQAGGFF